MATARFAWGIDVGNRALKAIKLVPRDGTIVIEDFEVIEHETILSQAGDNRDSLIQNALAKFAQSHSLRGGAVAIGVSGQASFARFIKLPPVEPSKIPQIVRFEAVQQIPFPLDDVEWDWQLFQDPESPDVEVGIFAMRKDLVNHHLKYFTDFELNVQVVQMNPLAVYNAMYRDDRIKGTTMVIDLGAEATDLIIAEGETIWLRSIPLGGNNFTEALVKAFKVNFKKAEDLKRNASTSKYGRQIMQAMRPIFADLVAEIQRSMGFYASVHRDSRIGRVIVLGGTFRLPGLQKYLQQNLQLEVERIDSLGAGALEDPRLASMLNENLLSSVGAYGLALQGLGEGKINSSLLPERIRREKMWRSKTKWFGLAASLFIVGAAIPYASYSYTNLQFQTSMHSHDSEIESAFNKANQINTTWQSDIENAGAQDRQLIQNVASLENYRDLWVRMTHDIYNCLPQFGADAKKDQPELTDPDPLKVKRILRGQRKEILIELMNSRFVPDMGLALKDDQNFAKYADTSVAVEVDSGSSGGGGFPGPGGMGSMGGGGFSADSGPPMGSPMRGGPETPAAQAVPVPTGPAGSQRGFFITLRCTTPNSSGVSLVVNTLVKNLQAFRIDNLPPGKPYYIPKVVVTDSHLVKDDQTRMTKMVSDYSALQLLQAKNNANMPGGPGFPQPSGLPGLNQPGAAGQTVDDAAFQDRVLGEDVRNDCVCTVLFAVMLDPPPPPPKTAAAGQ